MSPILFNNNNNIDQGSQENRLSSSLPEAPSPDSAAAYVQDLNTASTRIRVSCIEWFINYRKTALGADPTESGTTDYRRDYPT